jgi:hypothetical protein
VWPTAIRTKRLDDTRAYSQEGRFTSTDAQYAYDRYWFGLYMDKQDNVPIHPRYQNHPGVSQQQQHCNGNKMPPCAFVAVVFPLERLEILWRMRYRNLMPASVTSAMLNAAFPTHHQKCVLVDYGRRSVPSALSWAITCWTNTGIPRPTLSCHHPGSGPQRSLSTPGYLRRGQRPVLYYLHKNFVEGWQDVTGEDLARPRPPGRQRATTVRDNAQRCALLRRDQGQVTKAQILRTQSQKRPGYCRPLHPHAEKRHPSGVCGKPVFPLATLAEIKSGGTAGCRRCRPR